MSVEAHGVLDRREFFGRVALVAGGIAVTAALPWPAARALSGAAPQALARQASAAKLADWTIDDQWAPAPRYADAIGYARTPAPAALAHVGSIDALFYA
ncbi:MAG TPA: hypothetical protein VFV10_19065 [Gammaproteobacteria bacterium]|nr:hypothetical protein [Gammaproteobacteria bacterium]